MFDPKMKCLSLNQRLIFPVIALMLVASSAIAQDGDLEEVLLGESTSVEMSPAEVSVAISATQKDFSEAPPVGPQANIEMAVAEPLEDATLGNGQNEPLFGMATSLVPHVAIVSGLIVGLAFIRFLFRWRELIHKEHLLAIEKGLLKFQMNRKRLMLWGMVWMSLGIAAGAALWVNFDWLNAMWSLMPLFLGIVLLVYVGFIEKKRVGPQPAQVSSAT